MGKSSIRKILFSLALLPSFSCAMQICTWCYEKDVELMVKQLERSGCVIWAINCDNPEADISERRWIIEYEKIDWNMEKK